MLKGEMSQQMLRFCTYSSICPNYMYCYCSVVTNWQFRNEISDYNCERYSVKLSNMTKHDTSAWSQLTILIRYGMPSQHQSFQSLQQLVIVLMPSWSHLLNIVAAGNIPLQLMGSCPNIGSYWLILAFSHFSNMVADNIGVWQITWRAADNISGFSISYWGKIGNVTK